MASDLPDGGRQPGGEDRAVVRVYARRERHRRRSLPVRVLAGLAGALLATAGLVLLIPLPEAGVPATLAGLSLLALEFDWAARALVRVERMWARFQRLPLAVRVAVALVLAAVLIAALVLAI